MRKYPNETAFKFIKGFGFFLPFRGNCDIVLHAHAVLRQYVLRQIYL